MSDVQRIVLDNKEQRIESGAIRFNDDWPGLWLRGDDALQLMASIQAIDAVVAKKLDNDFGYRLGMSFLRGIADDIQRDVLQDSSKS